MPRSKSKNVKISPSSYIEMMDRLQVVITTIDIHLQGHPIAINDLRVSSLLDKTIENLSDIYALVMELSFEEKDKTI